MCALVLSMMITSSCGERRTSADDGNAIAETNIYTDATLRKIYELRCAENTAELIKFFSNEFPEYRKAAVLAVGTMKDSMATVAAASLLSDTNEEVREAAVFTIGQIGHNAGEKYLLEDLSKEQNNVVISSIYEALGKCGTENALEKIEAVADTISDITVISGVMKGFCHLASRGFYSINSTQFAIKILTDTTIHEKIRGIASEYFAISNADFGNLTDNFIKVYQSSKLLYTRKNLAIAFGRCHNERALNFLKEIITNDSTDYRVTINSIIALENYPYEDCKQEIVEKAKSYDDKIAAYAAQYLYHKGIKADSSEYLELSREVPGWQTRTQLLAAALKFTNNKKNISASIKSGFEVAQNIYEKTALLRALECDFSSYSFIENQSFYSDNEMLRTEGIKTLIAMYENPEFEKYSKFRKKNYNENLVEEFALIFKKAIQNGNTQMVALAAKAIANHKEIAEYYINTFFLNQALNNCVLPRDADTYMILIQAIKDVNGQIITPPQHVIGDVPDWVYICTIDPGEKIAINTQKGEIVLKTDINNAPIAVSNFMKLVDKKYFDNSCFTNISTAYVENKGSLTGYDENMSIMIPTELTNVIFDEGTVALVTTALNNSTATQWFIMLAPATIMDGTSSVIATVVDGMEYVHSLNTGDKILSVKRLKQ